MHGVCHALRVCRYTIAWLQVRNEQFDLIFLQKLCDSFHLVDLLVQLFFGQLELDVGFKDVGVKLNALSFVV
jgi:hypothetical protein